MRIYQSNPEHVHVIIFPNLSRLTCSARDDIVSKSLIVKDKGTVSEENADNFCGLQLPGWHP